MSDAEVNGSNLSVVYTAVLREWLEVNNPDELKDQVNTMANRSYTICYGANSAVIGGGDTLEEITANIARDVAYYTGLNYAINNIVIHEFCEACNGSGRIYNRNNRIVGKPCKPCKGNGVVKEWTHESQ